MKSLLLTTFLLPALPAPGQTCQLTGNIAGLGTRTIEYAYERQGETHTDSVRVVDGRFALAIVGGDGDLGTLLVRDPQGRGFQELPIWVEPGTVAVTGQASDLNHLTATGTPQNDVLADCRRTVTAKLCLHPRPHARRRATVCCLHLRLRAGAPGSACQRLPALHPNLRRHHAATRHVPGRLAVAYARRTAQLIRPAGRQPHPHPGKPAGRRSAGTVLHAA